MNNHASSSPLPTPAAAPPADFPFGLHLAPFAAGATVVYLLGDATPWTLALGLAVAVAVALWARPWREAPVWAHVAPFAAWVSMLAVEGEPAGWKYAVRTAVGVALLLGFRPWRWHAKPRAHHAPLGVAAGLAIIVLWVLPEHDAVRRAAPGFYDVWVRFCANTVYPGGFGRLPEAMTVFPYAPQVCGWPLTLARLAGSSFVIALAEEFFFRGFLYRWLQGRNFLDVDPGHFDRLIFFVVAILFGLEHVQWFAGIVCGLLFGWLYLRTRNLWTAIYAHVAANLVLSVYVLATGQYKFW